MQSHQLHQLKIDAFCRQVTTAKNEQPAQQAVSDNQNSLPAPPRRRRRVDDSDIDEGRAVMATSDERADSHSDGSSALQAQAVTSTRAEVSEAPTQQKITNNKGGSPGQTVLRTIHTETVTQVQFQNVCMHEK
jgi:pyruvate/2-oxoglutarate dehydrogenase complex dihydrolipoamide acyltransferase (E2) component